MQRNEARMLSSFTPWLSQTKRGRGLCCQSSPWQLLTGPMHRQQLFQHQYVLLPVVEACPHILDQCIGSNSLQQQLSTCLLSVVSQLVNLTATDSLSTHLDQCIDSM
jgi:hypothetical protein